jgi:hypothetical protein
MDVLAGADFFSVEVLTWRGLVTYYVLFFIHLESRKVSIAGITDHPEACWMRQAACKATLDGMGHLHSCRYLLHDRDAKFCPEFRETLAAGGVKCLRLPPRSPNLNAFAERWVRSVKQECLSHLILFGERSFEESAHSIPRALSPRTAAPHEYDHTGSYIVASSQNVKNEFRCSAISA